MTQAPGLAHCHSDGMTHLEVPVHNVMLVDVADAFQDLIDAMTVKQRERQRESREKEKRVRLGRETQALVQGLTPDRRSGTRNLAAESGLCGYTELCTADKYSGLF